jgi:lambda family phage portal protein
MRDVSVVADNGIQKVTADGGFAGASRTNRELSTWSSPLKSADGHLLREKDTLDARSMDIERNDGYVRNGIQTHKDSVVGGLYRLSLKPAYKLLGLDEVWAEEFQEAVESRFMAYAESPDCWIDASRHNTFTDMVRLAVAQSVVVGESLATVEWIRRVGRPYKTAIQLIDPIRLSNPDGKSDDTYLRKGVEMDRYGAPMVYHIREAVPNDYFESDMWRWKAVRAYKSWGRKMVLHHFEQQRVAQSRGIGSIVSVLKETKMSKKYNDMVLQNAVLNASFAAILESDLPPMEAFESISGDNGLNTWAAEYLSGLAAYTGESPNMQIDGVRIPHAYPGTKLKLQNVGQPGGVGTKFEESLLRRTAAGLGLSYEEYTRDFTQTNYSSFRAAAGQTYKMMMGIKKKSADGFANDVFRLWFEEALNAGDFKDVMPSNAPNFYDGMNKDFYTNCNWIGASRGQIDELKETNAALLRIAGGLSTYEVECARFGEDYREVFKQKAREQRMMESMNLMFNVQATAGGAGTKDAGGNAENESPKGSSNNSPEPADDDENGDENADD